jgi:hypothetical protein
MPELKEREPKQTALRQQRLQPAIDAAMKRRVDDAPPLPDGYTITPVVRRMLDNMGADAVEKFQNAQATGGPGVMDLVGQRQRRR